MTEASPNSKFFWFGFGVFLVFASQITYQQLETFKRRCEIEPSRQRDNLDKDIEDAIKLDTLHTLAKGVNYNLARASLRIIAERALSKAPFKLLLQQVVSPNPKTRLQALKTLRFLVCSRVKNEHFYENDSDYVLTKEIYELKLCTSKVYNALVCALFISLPSSSYSTERPHDKESEKCALESLARLLSHNVTLGIEPKLVLYLKHYPVDKTKYENIVHAFNDREYEKENYALYEIYMCVRRTGVGQSLLEEMGMCYDVEEEEEEEDEAGKRGEEGEPLDFDDVGELLSRERSTTRRENQGGGAGSGSADAGDGYFRFDHVHSVDHVHSTEEQRPPVIDEPIIGSDGSVSWV